MPASRTISRPPCHWRITAALSLAWIAVYPFTSAQAADFELEVVEGRISINSNGADIADILRRLSEETGFRLLIPAGLSRPSSRLQMQDAPLQRVLKRLLKEDSFVIITGDNEKVVAVHVLPRGNEQTVFLEVEGNSNSNTESQGQPAAIPEAGTEQPTGATDNGS